MKSLIVILFVASVVLVISKPIPKAQLAVDLDPEVSFFDLRSSEEIDARMGDSRKGNHSKTPIEDALTTKIK